MCPEGEGANQMILLELNGQPRLLQRYDNRAEGAFQSTAVTDGPLFLNVSRRFAWLFERK